MSVFQDLTPYGTVSLNRDVGGAHFAAFEAAGASANRKRVFELTCQGKGDRNEVGKVPRSSDQVNLLDGPGGAVFLEVKASGAHGAQELVVGIL